ncbi:DUF418 domain-containing protein [Saccharibacillus alkalitolerans]|uniref:DUF418 domain-containing protein n=1 Tax=Saccharibacillus alkalitolerans TaxID=2705290 RepID=A0ABX0F5D2_9BACL|nr:DUF418 domain-containing protein [Saccharibacillus alkalitolerans]NGZ75583.1 DUF418 domain-containing protein [Saccharibacillus alkalitolerans]
MELTNKKRIQFIDGLRGFSLSGIVLANMLIFQYGLYGEGEPALFGIAGADLAFHRFLFIAVVGSFMPIFAFMFGFGMVKLSDSLKARELRPKCHLARRFLLLFVIGLLHATFLWEGDILTFYGMTGFFLLLFLNRRPAALLAWAVLLMVAVGALGLVPNDPSEPVPGDSAHTRNYIMQSRDVYGSGTYAEIMDFRNNADPLEEKDGLTLAILSLLAPILIAPMFLLGMRAARKGTFDDPRAMRGVYARRAAIFGGTGLLTKAYGVLAPQLGGNGLPGLGVGDALGGSLLALGYIYAFALLYAGLRRFALLERFEAVGKLSLTNYLLQTVICTTIFYGYGFGLFGRAGVFAGAVLVLAVYAAQLWLSPLYLKKFRTGPVEKILRVWTYLSWKGQPRKRRKPRASADGALKVS